MTSPRKRPSRLGFTLVETLVTLVVAGIVLSAVYRVIVAQNRSYARQQEAADVHNTLRAAGALLAFDLRQVSAEEGDLVALGLNGVTIRASVGGGIVCRVHPTEPRYGLVEVSGDLEQTGIDSVLALARVGTDGTWQSLAVSAVGTAASLGVTPCVWTSGEAAEIGVEVVVGNPSDTAGIGVGSPMNLYRHVEYGLFQENGRWWLGRKIGSSATFDALTGPLLSDAQGGLEFTYRDADGNVTNNAVDVVFVEAVLRAESARKAEWKGSLEHLNDSLTVRIRLRG